LALLKGRAPTPQEFNELADAASADSLVESRFALDAERFVRGDHSGATALKATLASRNNHDRFAAVARGNPQLEAALPLSADIAALTEFGLDALAAIESERAPAMVRVVSANHRNRRLPLRMADVNVAGRRIDSDLDRGGQLPQAENSAVERRLLRRTKEARVLGIILQIAAVRTSRRRICNFLPQCPVALSLGKLMLSLAVEPRFISIDC